MTLSEIAIVVADRIAPGRRGAWWTGRVVA